jgi:ribosome recycling factor
MNYKHITATKILDHFSTVLSGVRSGRANSSVLEPIQVEMYGSKMQIKELATITLPEPATILITPFDKSAIGPISKAISNSNLGVNPIDDGAGVRLVFPPLTEETRKKLAKNISVFVEDAKIQVRNSRQDILKTWKKQKDDSELSEDDLKKLESQLQEEVTAVNKEIEEKGKKKVEEILKI